MEACSSKLDMESVQIRAWEWSENQFEEPRTQPNSSSQMDNDAREYWRPSYMFHWLRSIGRQMIEAYIAFEEYKGRTSYQEMELDKPRQIPRDDDGSEWSHMSDYDEFGLSLLMMRINDHRTQVFQTHHVQCSIRSVPYPERTDEDPLT